MASAECFQYLDYSQYLINEQTNRKLEILMSRFMGNIDEVTTETDKNSTIILLNRPNKRNALSCKVLSELKNVMTELDRDETCDVILLRAAGNDFCAGLDRDELAEGLPVSDKWHELYDAMSSMTTPVIGAIQGNAINAGAGLALLSDIVIVTEDVHLTVAEMSMGMIPRYISQILATKFGYKLAIEICLLSSALTAEDLRKYGMVSFVTNRDSLLELSTNLTSQIRNYSKGSGTTVKKLIKNYILTRQ